MNFYTRKEAATILSVTPHTISNYIRKGILKNYGNKKTVMLSCSEIHTFYENNTLESTKVNKSDIFKLHSKLSSLEAEVQTLKLAMGVGAAKRARTDTELQTLYMEIMSLLSRSSWTTKEIFYLADVMISMRDGEITRLLLIKGTRCWVGLFELAERMISFIDGMELPPESKDLITARLEAGRNRFYGLLYVSLADSIGVERLWAKRLLKHNKQETTDSFVERYIKNRQVP